jgi:hypothetical protein
MTETNQTEAQTPATEPPQDAAQPSDTKAEASSTAKASDELSEDDLEAVAGGKVSPIIEPIWKTPEAPPIVKD